METVYYIVATIGVIIPIVIAVLQYLGKKKVIKDNGDLEELVGSIGEAVEEVKKLLPKPQAKTVTNEIKSKATVKNVNSLLDAILKKKNLNQDP
jgi:hypothetical protein